MAVWAKAVEAETRECPAGRVLAAAPAAAAAVCTKCGDGITAASPVHACPDGERCPACRDTPLARMTTSSLCTARLPRLSNAPSSAAAGSI